MPKHQRAEIGCENHPEQWRKGYTSEAISKVLSYGFDVMDLTSIGAVVFIDNEASNNLLTKIGFQKEGVLKKYMYQYGKAHDTYVYSLLESNK
ncbi:RimJ/RimL family protein N-acetyltransferase [Peribacillus sp. B2I2]